MPLRQVALIMNVNKPYDRKIIGGIARYVHSIGQWSLYVEEDPLSKIPDLNQWKGDGIIADLDDERVVKAVGGASVPIVGVGGAAQREGDDMPYVTTNNEAVARLAAEHLLERGFRSFAYCGVPRTAFNLWDEEREQVFARLVGEQGFECSVFRGRHTTPRHWESLQQELMKWLGDLPRPVGLMACNDNRAHHVLEACRRVGLRVPEEVAILGVDNDELMCELAIPPLSSVIQGTDQMGYEAAALLDRMMQGKSIKANPRVVIDPVGIATRQSTDILAVSDPVVVESLRFIREHVGEPLQVSDVASHMHLSRSTLDTRFRETLHRTVSSEIQRLRLSRAQDLLRSTRMPLKQIATVSGYSTVQYMTAVFRRRLGQTPGQHAKMVRR